MPEQVGVGEFSPSYYISQLGKALIISGSFKFGDFRVIYAWALELKVNMFHRIDCYSPFHTQQLIISEFGQMMPPGELRNALIAVRWSTDYLLKIVAHLDRIILQSSGNLKMSGNEDHHRQGRRFAAGGNGHDGRDPRDVEIERLRQRVCNLEIQHEIRQIQKRIRELELQRELTKETESEPIIWDIGDEEEDCENAVSTYMVEKLALKTVDHLEPYQFTWLKKRNAIKVSKRCLVEFSARRKYKDKVWCEVIPMDACHILLGFKKIKIFDAVTSNVLTSSRETRDAVSTLEFIGTVVVKDCGGDIVNDVYVLSLTQALRCIGTWGLMNDTMFLKM
nr:reverse transcriptase domain-containing protein [Tanacetum cinerariifolium]